MNNNINRNSAYNSEFSERFTATAISKRLAEENQKLLDSFASSYLYLKPTKFSVKNTSSDNFRRGIQMTLDGQGNRYFGHLNEIGEYHGWGLSIAPDSSVSFGEFIENLREGPSFV